MAAGGFVENAKASRLLLAKAAVRLGGVGALASQLEISPRLLTLYIEGHDAVPDSLLLRVIDFILDDLPDPHSGRQVGNSSPDSKRR
jgi:hypothetical protein